MSTWAATEATCNALIRHHFEREHQLPFQGAAAQSRGDRTAKRH